MSSEVRASRKVNDEDIVRLNSVGLSLGTIADILGCHPTTITLRLKALGIDPADTRRSFMEEIYMSLPANQQKWLVAQLGPHVSIKDFIKNMLVKEFISSNTGEPTRAAA
jgi:hypothetical protein